MMRLPLYRQQGLLFGLSIFVLIALSGCIKTLPGPSFDKVYRTLAPLKEDESRIFFLWPYEHTSSIVAKVRINDGEEFDFRQSACMYRTVPSGKTSIGLDAVDQLGFSFPGDFKKHYAINEGSELFLKIEERSSRIFGAILLGPVGALIESGVAEESDSGHYTFHELTRLEAESLMPQCIFSK